MPRDDDYVRVEELPDLLRSYGVLPSGQRTVPASAARSVLSAFVRHPGGPGHKQESHGRRKGFGFDIPSTDTGEVLKHLHAGEKVRADPKIVDDLMSQIKKEDDKDWFNIAKLNISGKGNGNMFQRHVRDRPRKTMPQLPTETGPKMDQFMDYLDGKGVKYEYGTIDPRKLVASQSELNSKKVAKLYGFMRKDGWLEGGTIIISRDGAVIDGHHRWAAAAAASIASGGKMDVTVMKIDGDIDDVLGTPENPDGIVMGFATFEGLGDDREA